MKTIQSLEEIYKATFAEHAQVHAATASACIATLIELTGLCIESLENGGKILFAGNGGSAADAQHLAAELTIRFECDRPAMAAVALTTDTSALTAGANDLGFERIFSRQIEALGKPGDVFIGISTSGNSPNILLALQTAQKLGIKTVAFTGINGISQTVQPDLVMSVPSQSTARVQEEHITLGHMLCKGLEEHFSN